MTMNNYGWLKPRLRKKHLFVVEGNHEKDKLFKLIVNMYPEMDLDIDNVIIYGTNIYQLHLAIIKEYGEAWEQDEVDLAFVVSKKLNLSKPMFKNDFMNIVLVFDFERHDPNFSEEKIVSFQTYFQDAAEVGMLYINYPMVESYQHLYSIPDENYANRSIPVSLQPGFHYKNKVKDSYIAKLVDFPDKVFAILYERFNIMSKDICDQCVTELLHISAIEDDGKEVIGNILNDFVDEDLLLTVQYQLDVLIKSCGYGYNGKTYYEYMREIFKHVIIHNICKGNQIINGQYDIDIHNIENCFRELDYLGILEKQLCDSSDEFNGMIWVLNTSVFFVADYNFDFIISS